MYSSWLEGLSTLLKPESSKFLPRRFVSSSKVFCRASAHDNMSRIWPSPPLPCPAALVALSDLANAYSVSTSVIFCPLHWVSAALQAAICQGTPFLPPIRRPFFPLDDRPNPGRSFSGLTTSETDQPTLPVASLHKETAWNIWDHHPVSLHAVTSVQQSLDVILHQWTPMTCLLQLRIPNVTFFQSTLNRGIKSRSQFKSHRRSSLFTISAWEDPLEE